MIGRRDQDGAKDDEMRCKMSLMMDGSRRDKEKEKDARQNV